MSEDKNLGCSGDCGSCGEDCSTNEGMATVTLTLDDDSVIECAILTTFPADGREYIALLPLDENGQAAGADVYLYRYVVTDEAPTLENIVDDEEYEAAADAFDELMDQLEFADMDAE